MKILRKYFNHYLQIETQQAYKVSDRHYHFNHAYLIMH